jgi:ABC-type iron transport system FetAB permease component
MRYDTDLCARHQLCHVPTTLLATRSIWFVPTSSKNAQTPELTTVPILGMILGNAISAIGVGINTVHKEFSENRDKVETYLAMGASRFEAVKPVGVEALKLALLPTVNQMR